MTAAGRQRVAGVAVLAVLALAIALLMGDGGWLGGGGGMRVHVVLAHAGPLRTGHPVRVGGVRIGRIQSVRTMPVRDDGARVVLDLAIDRDHAWLLRDNSEFFQNQQALLSEPYLEVALPAGAAPGAALGDGAMVRGIDAVDLDRLLQRVWGMASATAGWMRAELPEIDELGAALDELERALDQVDPESVDRLASSVPALRDEVDGVLADVRAIDGVAPSASGLPARLQALSERVRAEVERLRARTDALAARVARIRDRLDPALRRQLDAALAAADQATRRVQDAVEDATALVEMVARGEGSLGALLADPELGDDVKAALRIMKQQPWRLLGKPQTRPFDRAQ